MVLLPAQLHYPTIEKFCLLLDGVVGNPKYSITVTLDSSGGSAVLFPKEGCLMTSFFCCTFMVPAPNHDTSEVATVTVEAKGDISFKESKLVVIQRITDGVVIQTDKPAYKPGDTVRFRITTLDENFKCTQIMYNVVELKDPDGNRIAQWLQTPTQKCIADLSFNLTSDPILGTYTINVENSQIQTFIVQEKVLPRFELTIEEPSKIYDGDSNFTLKVCARYTFGKYVVGSLNIIICCKTLNNAGNLICMHMETQTDNTGCFTTMVESLLQTNYEMGNVVQVDANFTEKDTDAVSSASKEVSVVASSVAIIFEEIDTHYRRGYPFWIRLLVQDQLGLPVPYKNIQLSITSEKHEYDYIYQNNVRVDKDTDKNGTATFALDTSEWIGQVSINAVGGASQGTLDNHVVSPFYSTVKSFVWLNPIHGVIPCGYSQTVQVHYIIDPQDLEFGTKSVNFYYIVIGKAGIVLTGKQKIILKDEASLNGTLNIMITFNDKFGTGPKMLGFLLLKQTLAAERLFFKVEICFPNQARLKFVPSEASPKEKIHLQLSSNAKSLCAVRAVDKSVQINFANKELTKELVYRLFPYSVRGGYPDSVKEELLHGCWWYRPSNPEFVDVFDLFQDVGLKILTNTQIRRPQYDTACPLAVFPVMMIKETSAFSMLKRRVRNDVVRKYFPETWLWQLVEIGKSGHKNILVTVPDTITQFNAATFCIGDSGFGLSPQVSLTVFKPFFVDLALPYSVIQGETFTLKALVFNYLKQCLKVQVTLHSSSKFLIQACQTCVYTKCICENESTNFNWTITANKIGFVPLTVRAEAINSAGNCMGKPAYVPPTGNLDILLKQLLVKPQGVKMELPLNIFLCLKGSHEIINRFISLEVPRNLVKDSESAYVSVTGDVLGTALQNLDRLITMPYGCGEQNMLTMAPIIYVLAYLSATGQLDSSLRAQALSYLQSGYQRELSYEHLDGSFSAFGDSDGEGSAWLTAFVIKCFYQAKNYIFIDDQVLTQAVMWLLLGQNENGCFANRGNLFHTLMKGGVEDDLSLSAYITAALLESGQPKDTVLDQALSCLKANVSGSSNLYTMALMAYTFTLANDMETRNTLLNKLYPLAVSTTGNDMYWSYNLNSVGNGQVSASIELTAYILLALVSGPVQTTDELVNASRIVNWLSKQQNPYGGFASTQDTVVAIQALAKYAKITFSSQQNLLVTVFANKVSLKQFKVDGTNRLLLQKHALPNIPGNYQLTISGIGCVFIQTVLKYNILPVIEKSPFSISAKIVNCDNNPGLFTLSVTCSYNGARTTTNMVIIEVEMLSGFVLWEFTKQQLLENPNVKRVESGLDSLAIYLDEMIQATYKYNIMMAQDVVVLNLKPVNVKIYDYYQPEESATTTYGPCPASR